MYRTLHALFGLALLSLAACQSVPTPLIPSAPPTTIQPTIKPSEPTAVLSSFSIPEATFIIPASSPSSAKTPVVETTPSPTSDPLRFVFPTSRPAAISAWRPPLYPTPWAPTQVDHFYFGRPIAADVVNWPLADYRYGGVFFEDVVHTGIDIPAKIGTPVFAAGPGKVTWAGYGLYTLKDDPSDPYGLAVSIKHDFGYEGETIYTIYGHMNEILVTKGQHVEGGQLIGVVGETGKVTGPHLHFEVRIGKNNFFGSRNPELWLSPPQGWGVLAGRVMSTSGNLIIKQAIQVRSLSENQWWEVITYGKGSTNSDPYYQENIVLGDLPAGEYEVWIGYQGVLSKSKVIIQPGLVTYFQFQGRNGFSHEPLALPGEDFSPTNETVTP